MSRTCKVTVNKESFTAKCGDLLKFGARDLNVADICQKLHGPSVRGHTAINEQRLRTGAVSFERV